MKPEIEITEAEYLELKKKQKKILKKDKYETVYECDLPGALNYPDDEGYLEGEDPDFFIDFGEEDLEVEEKKPKRTRKKKD